MYQLSPINGQAPQQPNTNLLQQKNIIHGNMVFNQAKNLVFKTKLGKKVCNPKNHTTNLRNLLETLRYCIKTSIFWLEVEDSCARNES